MTEIYKVTIQLVRAEEKLTEKSWERTAEKTDTDNGYGYTPQVLEVKDVTREVFTYETTELDVPKVIAAVLENSKAI